MDKPTSAPSRAHARPVGESTRTHSHERTLVELAEQFLALKSRQTTTGSYMRYKSVVSRLLRDLGETASLSAISSELLEAHFRKRAKQASPGSLGLEISAVKHMYSLAVERGWALRNPAESLKTPRRPSASVKTLNREEFNCIWAAAPSWIRPCLALAVTCGLRRGDILAIRAKDIDLIDRFLVVRHRKHGIRKVPLGEAAISVLKTVMGKDHESRKPLFKERQMTAGNLSQTFLRALRSSGIDHIDGLSFDDLRYTGAHWLLSQGASLQTLAEFLGHGDLRMIEKLACEIGMPIHKAIISIDDSLRGILKTMA